MKVLNTELNPKLFTGDELKPSIRERLLEITDEFLSFVDDKLDFDILDIRIVGSNAGYNYTDTSDIDLHIVVNLAEICRETPELVQFLFNSEKSRFNLLYDVSIKNTDVEVYVEDVKAGTHSNGIYSVLYDKWVKVPQEDTNDYEKIYQEVRNSEEYLKLVNEVKQVLASGNSKDIKEELNKVYLIRKYALDRNGELGLGNIMFKLLRSEGYLDKLRGDYYETRSRELTVESIRLREDTDNSEVVSEIEDGDLVYFGSAYGNLYVVDSNFSDDYFWVTDEEEDRGNRRAYGNTMPKYMAERIVEKYEDSWDDEDDWDLDEGYYSDSSYKIRYYYDRYTRSWVTQVIDEEGNEVETDYSGDKTGRDFACRMYSKDYNTNDIGRWED